MKCARGPLDKLKARKPLGRMPIPMAIAPAITVGIIATKPTLTPWNSPNLTLRSAQWSQVGANPRGAPVTVSYDGSSRLPLSGACYANSGSIYFVTDSAAFEIDGLFNCYRIYMDLGDGAGWRVGGTVQSAGTATRYFTLVDCGAFVAPSAPKRVRIDVDGAAQLYGISTLATETVWPLRDASPARGVLIGDSFAEGVGAQFGALDGYAQAMGRILGFDDWIVAGAGGTGLLQPNGARVNYLSRLSADVINQAPDLIVLQCTQNDNSLPLTQVHANLSAIIQAIRAALPQSIVVILGVWNANSSPSALATALNGDLAATALGLGVPYIDQLSWITGSGNIGAPAGNGNADIYVSPDGVHPSAAGHLYRAQRCSDAICSIMANLD